MLNQMEQPPQQRNIEAEHAAEVERSMEKIIQTIEEIQDWGVRISVLDDLIPRIQKMRGEAQEEIRKQTY